MTGVRFALDDGAGMRLHYWSRLFAEIAAWKWDVSLKFFCKWSWFEVPNSRRNGISQENTCPCIKKRKGNKTEQYSSFIILFQKHTTTTKGIKKKLRYRTTFNWTHTIHQFRKQFITIITCQRSCETASPQRACRSDLYNSHSNIKWISSFTLPRSQHSQTRHWIGSLNFSILDASKFMSPWFHPIYPEFRQLP